MEQLASLQEQLSALSALVSLHFSGPAESSNLLFFFFRSFLLVSRQLLGCTSLLISQFEVDGGRDLGPCPGQMRAERGSVPAGLCVGSVDVMK